MNQDPTVFAAAAGKKPGRKRKPKISAPPLDPNETTAFAVTKKRRPRRLKAKPILPDTE